MTRLSRSPGPLLSRAFRCHLLFTRVPTHFLLLYAMLLLLALHLAPPTTASRAPPNSAGGRRRARTSGDPLDKPSSAMTLYISLSLSKPLASRIGARTLRNLDGGLGKMNSNSGKKLRMNARCRTPFSNSLHADHNRSTTGLYSPRDAPTTHSTPYFTGTGAPAPPRDAL